MTPIFNTFSEIGPLRTVMLHRPGDELLNLSPDSLDRLLFDDIPFLEGAQREHDTFARMLAEEGVEVLYLDQLVAEAIDAAPDGRELFVDRYVDECGLEGCDALQGLVRDVLLAQPTTKALVDKAISGIRADEVDGLPRKAGSLADILNANGTEEDGLLVDPIPNIYFTRDTFSVIGTSVSINRMLSATRRRESLLAETIFSYHPTYAGVRRVYDRDLPFHIEGGDILNLREDLLAIGLSQRSSPEGIELLASRLFRDESCPVRRILVLDIPNMRAFMHLDTVFTQVDRDKFTVHPDILTSLRIYDLRRDGTEIRARELQAPLEDVLRDALELDRVTLIRCGGKDNIASAREQWNDGSNTLCVAPGKVIVYNRNYVTNEILRSHGIEVFEMPSSELARGRGGPRCMSMPLVRESL